MKYVPVIQTIDHPTDEQMIDRKLFAGGEPVLCCPVCKFESTHVQSVYTLIGGDESVGLYRGSYVVAVRLLIAEMRSPSGYTGNAATFGTSFFSNTRGKHSFALTF